jgi:hypothetical protein
MTRISQLIIVLAHLRGEINVRQQEFGADLGTVAAEAGVNGEWLGMLCTLDDRLRILIRNVLHRAGNEEWDDIMNQTSAMRSQAEASKAALAAWRQQVQQRETSEN